MIVQMTESEIIKIWHNDNNALGRIEKPIWAKQFHYEDELGIDDYYKVITVDVSGTIRYYYKELNSKNSNWLN